MRFLYRYVRILSWLATAITVLVGCSTPIAAPAVRPPSPPATRVDYNCFPHSVFTADDMQRRVDCHPKDYKLELSKDTVVLFAFPDPMLDWVGPVFIIHVPSVSELVLNADGSTRIPGYKTVEGKAAIENVLNDSDLMTRILKRAAELQKGP